MKHLIPTIGLIASCAIIWSPEAVYSHWALTIWAAAIGGLAVQVLQLEGGR